MTVESDGPCRHAFVTSSETATATRSTAAAGTLCSSRVRLTQPRAWLGVRVLGRVNSIVRRGASSVSVLTPPPASGAAR